MHPQKIPGSQAAGRWLTIPVNCAIMRAMKNPRKTSADLSPCPAAPQLGAFLRAERESRGWTLEQVAKRLQVTKGYISRLEVGKAKPAAKLIELLAKTWQIDPNPLLILAGHIPADLREILRSHPVEAPSVLRESFGDATYDKLPPDAPPLRVCEERSSYAARTP